MAEIKDLTFIGRKWARVTPQRADEYKQGVTNPRRPWEGAAIAAEGTYKTAVIAAANAGRFGAGVRKASNAKWSDRAQKKGPARFAEGVQIGEPDYIAGFTPYHGVIARTTLTPRGPKGSPGNYDRVKQIGTALNAAKTSAK